MGGEGSAPVVAQVERAFHGGDEVAEGLFVAETGGEGGTVDEGGASGELRSAYPGEQGCGGDVDSGVDEGGADVFGEVFDQVGALGAGGGAGVEPVDLVDHHQLDTRGGIGVADGVGDLGLGHAGGDGDAEVAGEFDGESLGTGCGRDQDVGDRDRSGLLPPGDCVVSFEGDGHHLADHRQVGQLHVCGPLPDDLVHQCVDEPLGLLTTAGAAARPLGREPRACRCALPGPLRGLWRRVCGAVAADPWPASGLVRGCWWAAAS